MQNDKKILLVILYVANMWQCYHYKKPRKILLLYLALYSNCMSQETLILYLQWNLSHMGTLGLYTRSVLIKVVSLFQRLFITLLYAAGTVGRVLPRMKWRPSGWAWFGRSLWPHQSFWFPHQRNRAMEGMGGHYAERAWGEHWCCILTESVTSLWWITLWFWMP